MNVAELEKREIKRIVEKIKEEYSIQDDLSFLYNELVWFVSKKEKKIYIVHRNVRPLIKILGDNISRFGLYIARMEKDGIRLSIEGSQLFGPLSKKRILIKIKELLTSNKPELNEKPGYYIIKDLKKNYFSGTIKVTSSGKILDFIPKNRKIALKGK